MSGEPTLVDAFNQGWDLHARTATTLWGEATLLSKYPTLSTSPIDQWRDKSEDFKRNEGQLGKTVNFADGYWAGAKRMQATALTDMGLLLPLPFFHQVVSTRRDRRPILYEWQEKHLWEVTRTGCSLLPFTGHSRLFVGYNYANRLNRTYRDEEEGKDQTSEVLNHPIQTTAANILHRIAAALGKLLPSLSDPNPPCYCYTNVYDSLAFDCKRSWLADLKSRITSAIKEVEERGYWALLCSHYGHRVPLDFKITVK